MRVGYLATHYPAVSHTFVLREVLALRRLGVEVEPFSIHRSPERELMSETDREEARRTYSVLPARWPDLLVAHLDAVVRHPRSYVRTLAHAASRANPGLKGRLWGLFYFAEAMAVWHVARRRGVRHLHAIFADGASDVALLVTRFGGEAWSWSIAVHGPVEFYDVTVNHLAEKLASARFAVAISDFGRSQLMTLASEERWPDIHVVRCGVEPVHFCPPARWPEPDEAVEILCVGRLVHLKAQGMLIDACAELLRRGLATRLVLVGAGPKRAELEEQAERLGLADRVRFTGALGQDEVRALYAAVDIFCLPSLSEGLPVVLMEAMAMAVPVVTTTIMGIPELVRDGITGLLVAPGRLDRLVEALAQLVTDGELRRDLGRAGRDAVLAQHDVQASARQLRDVFSSRLE